MFMPCLKIFVPVFDEKYESGKVCLTRKAGLAACGALQPPAVEIRLTS